MMVPSVWFFVGFLVSEVCAITTRKLRAGPQRIPVLVIPQGLSREALHIIQKRFQADIESGKPLVIEGGAHLDCYQK